MTTSNNPDPVRTRPSSSRGLLAVLALTLVAALAVGMYANWYLWHPMSGIVATLGAAILILVGGIAALIRNRRVRAIAAMLLVAGFGTIVGQNVGPDRPPIFPHETGTLRLVLSAPTAFDATGDATCSETADASQVTVDPGEFGLARASEDADFHYVHIAIGDMYDVGARGRRDDHLSLTIEVQPALLPADGKPAPTRLTSDGASVLTLGSGHTLEGGSLTFANLAIGDPADPARRSDVAGTVSWTCGPVTPDDSEPDVEPYPKEPAPSDVPSS